MEELRAETTAWQQHTKDKQRDADWQFRSGDARMKLKSICPKSKT
jgi:hypothetical protein